MKVELLLESSAVECYRQFCDPSSMRLWLPELKQLKVVRSDSSGRALEVQYSLGESLTYALVYAYDDAARKVRWVPSSGALDAVSGFASFEPEGSGCRFVYSLDSRRGREPEHAADVAEAFARWTRNARLSVR